MQAQLRATANRGDVARHRHTNSLESSVRAQGVGSAQATLELSNSELIKVIEAPARPRVVVRNEEIMEEREKLIRFIR